MQQKKNKVKKNMNFSFMDHCTVSEGVHVHRDYLIEETGFERKIMQRKFLPPPPTKQVRRRTDFKSDALDHCASSPEFRCFKGSA
jgi:hypothetical protein